MKIAVVTWSYDEHQGISRCVVELTARLARGHEVHVFAAHRATDARPGVQVYEVPLRFPQVHVNDYDFFARAGRSLKRGSYDIVHAHFPVWHPTDVYTCHGLARMALRSFRRFPAEAKIDVPTLKMLRWHLQVPIHSYAVRRRGTLLAAVSGKVARELAEESGRALGEITIVPNGVDLERFTPEARVDLRAGARHALGLADDQFVLLWVGNHLRHKGLRHALDTLARLPERTLLAVVGADSPASVPELAVPIARLQAAGRLRFFSADNAIERYYAAADALLFPSLYESFGLVVLEAMAMGVPVVTARTVGFADEAIENGVNGLLVEHPWQSAHMAARLQALMDDGRQRARISEAGVCTARQYSWDAYWHAHEALYAQALSLRTEGRRGAHAA